PFAGDDNADANPALFVARGLPDEAPPPGSGAFVQVIGESGAGKSTHVHRWRSRAPGPLHYIPLVPYRRRWRRPPLNPIVYGDEIDRMPGPQRWRWFRLLARHGATLVIGSHVDLSDLARKAGFGRDGCELSTFQLPAIDRAALDAMLDARIVAAAIDDTVEPAALLTDADRKRILDRSAGSIRHAETIGHELIAARVR
ncbi:MAG: hypothetical protein ACR2QO_22430, partial [Acidimicrobiales bacterium]